MISTHLAVLCSCFLIIYKSVLYKKLNRKKIFLLTICVGSDKVANEMEVNMKKSGIITPIILLMLGLVLLIVPGSVINIVIRVFGVIIMISGAISIYQMIKENNTNYELVYGILICMLGLVFVSSPSIIASIIPTILGIWFIIEASTKLQYVLALRSINAPLWIRPLIVNILMLLLGLVLIFNPFKGAETILRIVAIFIVVYAVLDIVEYYMTKPKKVKVIK